MKSRNAVMKNPNVPANGALSTQTGVMHPRRRRKSCERVPMIHEPLVPQARVHELADMNTTMYFGAPLQPEICGKPRCRTSSRSNATSTSVARL